MTNNQDTWPAGATWVFQGVVVEDSTGGTHVSSLTVTPGAGNEMQILYGQILAGNGAANLTQAQIDDGTNVLVNLVAGSGTVSLSANQALVIPAAFTSGALAAAQGSLSSGPPLMVSGTMRFRFILSTATISLTHAFSLVCRIKGAMPTATLADTVGVPTLTVNTNKVF